VLERHDLWASPRRVARAAGDRLRVRFPLCAIFTFDGDDGWPGKRSTNDRATVLHQLGVFHEPEVCRAASTPR